MRARFFVGTKARAERRTNRVLRRANRAAAQRRTTSGARHDPRVAGRAALRLEGRIMEGDEPGLQRVSDALMTAYLNKQRRRSKETNKYNHESRTCAHGGNIDRKSPDCTSTRGVQEMRSASRIVEKAWRGNRDV